MPTKIHEYFAGLVREHLRKQIFKPRGNSLSTVSFLNELIMEGSPLFKSEESKSSHSPDIHISHSRAKFPAIVVEVTHSQSRKNLLRVAHEYMHDFRGNVDTIFGISTVYKSRQATIDVWKTMVNQNVAKQLHIVQSEVCMLRTTRT